MAERDSVKNLGIQSDSVLNLSCGSRSIEKLAQHFATEGFCQIPSLLGATGIESLVAEALCHQHLAHRSKEEVNPFLESPEAVRRINAQANVRSRMDSFLLRVVAYDQFQEDSVLKRLYLSDSLLKIVRTITATSHLERFGDSLGAVNLTFMTDGDKVPWHFDHSGHVLSIALTRPRAGGEFEIVAKSTEDREEIARKVLGDHAMISKTLAIEPGSAIFFNGKRCLHRVRTVEGNEPRIVALFGYDSDPKAHATLEANLGRYGRKA